MTWQFRHADGCGCGICVHRRRVAAIMRRDFRAETRARTTPEAETPQPDPSETPAQVVPDGTIADVLGWVDEDPDTRAQVAYDHETAGHGRVTLLAELETRGATPTGGDEQ